MEGNVVGINNCGTGHFKCPGTLDLGVAYVFQQGTLSVEELRLHDNEGSSIRSSSL